MKVPYEQVSIEVDKLYAMPSETDQQVAELAQAIDDFIVACGWTTDDYWMAWLSYNEGLTDEPRSLTLTQKELS